jgi:hypothetical protein
MTSYMRQGLITNAEIRRITGINKSVPWLMDAFNLVKPFDQIGRYKLYQIEKVIDCFEKSDSAYLRKGAELLRQATQKE